MSSPDHQDLFDKIRLPLAIFLSSAVFFVYIQFFSPKPAEQPPAAEKKIETEVDQNASANPGGQPLTKKEKIAQPLPADIPVEESFHTLSNRELTVTFSTINAGIVNSEVRLYSRRDGSVAKKDDLELGGQASTRTGNFSFEKGFKSGVRPIAYKVKAKTDNSIQFLGYLATLDGKIEVVKTFTLEKYGVKLDLQLLNPNEVPILQTGYLFNGSSIGKVINEADKTAFDVIKLAYNKEDDYINALKDRPWHREETYVEVNEATSWIAIENRFYTRLIKPDAPKHASIFWKTGDAENPDHVGAYEVKVNLPAGHSQQDSFGIYYLPKSRGVIQALDVDGLDFNRVFDNVLLMKVLINVMYSIVMWVDSWAKDFGVAIILMTLMLKIVTFPLTHKSYMSMQKMSKLNPKLTEIRKKNQKNPQKANQEIMALYKKEGVNPAMGCLPMMIPIPIFFALYLLFQNMIELDGASFLWIDNLALADHFLKFPQGIPLIGEHFNLLPPIMALSQFFQSMLTPTTAGGNEMAETQAKMMKYFFPVVFLFICWSLPSALVLYWLCQNILSIFQTLLTKRKA